MVKTFDEFIDKKRSKLPNRAYEHKYPQNLESFSPPPTDQEVSLDDFI